MLEDPADADKADKLRRSVREYLGIELQHLGVIFRDELQGIALGSRIPIIRYKPGSVLSRAVYRIAEKIQRDGFADEEPLPWLPGGADAEEAAPTAAAHAGSPGRRAGSGHAAEPAAEEEAEADFKVLRQDLEDLLSSGTLSMADMVEAVRSQHVELDELRRENALLKARSRRAAAEAAADAAGP
jgi:flagellar biosynthesis protein FlhG